jgi:hypothetical protein
MLVIPVCLVRWQTVQYSDRHWYHPWAVDDAVQADTVGFKM